MASLCATWSGCRCPVLNLEPGISQSKSTHGGDQLLVYQAQNQAGLPGCWPLPAMVRATSTEVAWSGFHQPQRPEWGELPLGPYVFSRPAYDEALAAPVPLTQDPLASLLGEC
ncbi:hypothetical protein ACVHNB_18995 [Streptomyces sp. YJ-C3]